MTILLLTTDLMCSSQLSGAAERAGAEVVLAGSADRLLALAAEHPARDFILSRILWLSGCEVGINRLGDVDSMQRYIYIHGTPDTEPMGIPRSHGCVRMCNKDVVELFERVPAGTPVTIR